MLDLCNNYDTIHHFQRFSAGINMDTLSVEF